MIGWTGLVSTPSTCMFGKRMLKDAVTTVVVPDMDLERVDFARHQLEKYPNNGSSKCECKNPDECSQPFFNQVNSVRLIEIEKTLLF